MVVGKIPEEQELIVGEMVKGFVLVAVDPS